MASFISKPYYMTNEEWYRFDEEKWKHVLTDKATPEAIESYDLFMKSMQEISCDEKEEQRTL